jgi:hypothetical protein
MGLYVTIYLYCLHPVVYYIVLLYNCQHKKFVRNNQCYMHYHLFYYVHLLHVSIQLCLHQAFLTSSIHEGDWLASCPCSFTPGGKKALSTEWTGNWVGPRASLDTVEKKSNSCPWQELNPSHPSHSSIYWLSFHGSNYTSHKNIQILHKHTEREECSLLVQYLV